MTTTALAAREQARDRNRNRRTRNRRNLVAGVNGRPYAMRRDPDGELVDDLEHGREGTYCNRLCRCTPCCDANAVEKARRDRGVAAGDAERPVAA